MADINKYRTSYLTGKLVKVKKQINAINRLQKDYLCHCFHRKKSHKDFMLSCNNCGCLVFSYMPPSKPRWLDWFDAVI